jgi:hypothetical protein
LGPLPFPTWASKLAFERLRSTVRAATVAWGCLLAVAACQGEYSLAPTACDDHCRAIQRADCSEDYPADCVRDCENVRHSWACDETQRAVAACYAAVDAADFACVNDHSQPGSICLPERRALSECLAPGSGACFDQCVRQAEACGTSLSDCEAGCQEPTPGCEQASNAYNTCLLDVPVECRDFFEPDTRPIEEIPCGDEGIAAFVCGE